jgi:hypothetical protein
MNPYMPAHVEVVFKALTSIIEFKALKPDSLMKFFNPDFSFTKFMTGEEGKGSLVNSMQVYILALGAGAIIIVLISLLTALRTFRAWAKSKLIGLKKKLMWNGVIRTITISFVQQLTMISLKIRERAPTQTSELIIQCIVITVYLYISFTLVVFNRDQLSAPQFQEKYSNLVPELRLKNTMSRFTYPLFLLRRILFIVVPVFLPSSLSLLFLVAIVCQLCTTIYTHF